MSDAAERLVNLALFLAGPDAPVTAEDVRTQVFGYPEGQETGSFLRMFERDKDDLRAAGLAIRVTGDGDEARYGLDPAATYSAQLELTVEDAAVLRVVAASLARDPSFPFAADLRYALAKLAPGAEATGAPVATMLADEAPAEQGAAVAALTQAATSRKRATFAYTTASGATAERHVEPYGLFLREGRWYLVGRDTDRDAVRVFAVVRMSDLTVDTSRIRTPDFDIPAGFTVLDFERLRFQYGPETIDAEIRFAPGVAWRAPRLAEGHGELEEHPDGSVTWRVAAGDGRALLRWVLENGPGIGVVGPPPLVASLSEGLEEVARRHG